MVSTNGEDKVGEDQHNACHGTLISRGSSSFSHAHTSLSKVHSKSHDAGKMERVGGNRMVVAMEQAPQSAPLCNLEISQSFVPKI